MRPLLILAACMAAAPVFAAEQRSSLKDLLARVSTYLNSPPVKKARVAAAVAAVRGSAPVEGGVNLDELLLSRAYALRQRLSAGTLNDEQRRGLRSIYRALALSEWVQANELDESAALRPELQSSVRDWLRERPAPAKLSEAVRGMAPGFDTKALVGSGWGEYCRGLVSGPAPEAGGPVVMAPDGETARLDEALKGISSTWLTKDLPKDQGARAHAIAGQLYAELAKAPLTGASLKGSVMKGGEVGRVELAQAKPLAVAPAAAEPQFSPRAIYAAAAPSVVFIMSSSEDGNAEIGTGSVIAPGRVLTNAHVVIRDSSRQPWPSVRVYFKPEKMSGDPKSDLANPVSGRVLAWDSGLDLALVAIDEAPARAALALGDPGELVPGDRVAAIGHPEQGGLWTLTTGVVSTLVANIGGVSGKNAIQTDASINRGNSGGPLLDGSGHIVGVNTLMSRKAADGLAITAVNFAVRADVARRWLQGQGGLPASAQAAAPVVPAAAPAEIPAPRPAPKPDAASATPAPAAKGPKREMVTESKPFKRDKLIEDEIREMEALESEMREEIRRRIP